MKGGTRGSTHIYVLVGHEVVRVIRVPEGGGDVHGGRHGAVDVDVVVGVDGERGEPELRPGGTGALILRTGHCGEVCRRRLSMWFVSAWSYDAFSRFEVDGG